MKLSSNVMIDKLLTLINDGHQVVRISTEMKVAPCKFMNFYLSDDTVEKLDLDMTIDEYHEADKTMRAWCNMLKKLDIVG